MDTILITDSLFIHDRHVALIKEAGYEVERISKPDPTEDELVTAIKGKVGYILGGIEHVTERVIDAADKLKVISFCGTGYKDFIPAWEHALKKGIAITKVPDGHTQAVAEWAVTMALVMERQVFELGRTGSTAFMTTPGLEGRRIGIVGYGHIGRRLAELLRPFRPAEITYFSRREHPEAGIRYLPLDRLLRESDIVFLCVSKEAGEAFFGERELAAMKDGALLVSFMSHGIIQEPALLRELASGRIRAVSDYPMQDPGFQALPLSHWFCNNGSNAFNTVAGIAAVSDTATESILTVLRAGTDAHMVQ